MILAALFLGTVLAANFDTLDSAGETGVGLGYGDFNFDAARNQPTFDMAAFAEQFGQGQRTPTVTRDSLGNIVRCIPTGQKCSLDDDCCQDVETHYCYGGKFSTCMTAKSIGWSSAKGETGVGHGDLEAAKERAVGGCTDAPSRSWKLFCKGVTSAQCKSTEDVVQSRGGVRWANVGGNCCASCKKVVCKCASQNSCSGGKCYVDLESPCSDKKWQWWPTGYYSEEACSTSDDSAGETGVGLGYGDFNFDAARNQPTFDMAAFAEQFGQGQRTPTVTRDSLGNIVRCIPTGQKCSMDDDCCQDVETHYCYGGKFSTCMTAKSIGWSSAKEGSFFTMDTTHETTAADVFVILFALIGVITILYVVYDKVANKDSYISIDESL